MSGAPSAGPARQLEPPSYQWVLCDDQRLHAVWDDTIAYSALCDGAKPWLGVCKQQIAMTMGRPAESAAVCWACLAAMPPDAIQAPWRGKTL